MKIVITTPNNFTKEAKEQLVKQGVCIVEAKNPESVRVISEADFGDADQILLSVLDAVDTVSNSSVHEKFYRSLSKRIRESKNGK